MCFSAEGDVAAGIIVTGIGFDAWRHLRGRKTHLLLATVPLILGLHQLDESLVWWSLQGDVPHSVGRVATWIYVVIALMVVPVIVPLAILRLEPTVRRQRVIAPFVGLGLGVAIFFLVAMLRHPIRATLGSYHVAYSINLTNGILVVGFYVLATCGALLFSGYRHVVVFGVANLAAVVVLARLTADGFASLWCLYAALTSAAISLHMRLAKTHRQHPYALT